jgi:hypothetical protein
MCPFCAFKARESSFVAVQIAHWTVVPCECTPNSFSENAGVILPRNELGGHHPLGQNDVAQRLLFSRELNVSSLFPTYLLKVYSLSDSKRHVNCLGSDDSTRLWVERTLRHVPIFVVMGLVTATDPEPGTA